jgi:hypothetical protein
MREILSFAGKPFHGGVCADSGGFSKPRTGSASRNMLHCPMRKTKVLISYDFGQRNKDVTFRWAKLAK